VGWLRSSGLWLRLWALLGVAVVFGVLLAVVAGFWLPGPAAAAVGSVVAASIFGVASSHGKQLLEKRARQRDLMPEHLVSANASGRLRRVRALDDPVALRVHPAALLRQPGGDVDRVPPYVRRDIHSELEQAVARGGFVVVIGDSTAGKTRAAYEVLRATLPDHFLIAPVGREALETAVPVVAEHKRCVVWLDDLERFLGPGGLTPNRVHRMLGGDERRVLLLATLRSAEFDRYGARAESVLGETERESWRVTRDVLAQAVVLEMRRQWSIEELDRAQGFADDPRIRGALATAGSFGLAEILAAGPELSQDWRNAWRPGAHPTGAALVSAAVDCRRAGVHDPIPEHLLVELAEDYLARQGGALLRPEPLAEALAWATEPSHGTSSLLSPTNQQNHYLAFDYLIDLPGLAAVPRRTWDILIERATPEQAFAIGVAAQQRFQFHIAVTAHQKAAAHHVADAELELARSLATADDPASAAHLLADVLADMRRARSSDEPEVLRLRHELAWLTARCGDTITAVGMFERLAADCEQLLGKDHPVTLRVRLNLAYYRADLIGPQQSFDLLASMVSTCRQVFGDDDPETLTTRHRVAVSAIWAGDLGLARELLTGLLTDRQRVLGPDHPDTLRTQHTLAGVIGRAGEPARAAAMFRQLSRDRERTLGPDHRQTLASRHEQVSFLIKAGERTRAAALFGQLLADWQRMLGPDRPGTDVVRELLAAYSPGNAPRWKYVRRALSDFHDNCALILGPDHDLTKEANRLITDLTPEWRKSSHSGGGAAECVEIAHQVHRTAVRDSKNPAGGRLAFGLSSWIGFLGSIKEQRC
jgi:uncharacterized protein DUF397/tetratricopeptide repeat protein